MVTRSRPPSVRFPRTAIQIFTLGAFRLEAGGEPLRLPARANNRPVTLLKLLIALGTEGVSVASLCEHLWPDADGDHAIDAFNTTLSRLRKRIGHDALRLEDGRLSLDSAVCRLDLWEIQAALSRASAARGSHDSTAAAQAMDSLLALYRGSFLEGEHTPPIVYARERMHRLVLRHIQEAATALEGDGRFREAAALYERGIDLDDAEETFHQGLMRVCLKLGRHADGVHVFHRCQSALRQRSMAEPSPTTQAIAAALLAGTAPPGASGVERDEVPAVSLAVTPLWHRAVASPAASLSDGVVAEALAGLHHMSLLNLVQHNVAVAYDPRPKALEKLVDTAGVDYVLTGNVQQSGERLRVQVRLLEARTRKVL